jgi:hypothetical protein
MTISITNSPFVIMDEYCKAISGFVSGVQIDDSNLECKVNSNTGLTIQGYSDISAGTNLAFDLYVKVSSSSATTWYPRANIAIFSKDDKKIIQADTNYMTYSTTYGA